MRAEDGSAHPRANLTPESESDEQNASKLFGKLNKASTKAHVLAERVLKLEKEAKDSQARTLKLES